MVKVTYSDGKVEYDKNAFYQYDYGQELEVHGLTLPDSVQVHFARKDVPALINIGTTVAGVMRVLVPAETLRYDGEFNVYIYISTGTTGQTYKAISFNTRKREIPGDYAPPDEPNVIQQFMDKLDQIIETGIADYEPHIETVNGMIAEYVPANLIVNNDAATVPGKAWDALKGKEIRNDVTILQDNKLDKTGNTKDATTTFTEHATDTDIASTDKQSTLFGKILKSIKTLRSAIGTLSALPTTNKASIVGAITEINNNLASISTTITSQYGTVTGGYIKVGKIVIVSLKVVTTSSITAGANLVTGLPIELIRTSMINVLDASADAVKKCSIRDGNLTALESLATNSYGYIVSGAYIAA